MELDFVMDQRWKERLGPVMFHHVAPELCP
jgi:hypothetical protein